MTEAEKCTELARMRTVLANRRTFLAWCRTALAVMGIGVLLEKAGLLLGGRLSDVQVDELGVMGIVALVAGPVLIAFAGWQYVRVGRQVGGDPDYVFVIPEMVVFTVAVAFVLLSLWAM
ncbi:YidH family protein [Salidesulfovibrio brasiliensis]|uniref:YidH family protein n=1 Tax=Salidesulfovibrio brasiliensis TaxID=221711 RepID=UPI0006D02A3E|nr:DUF202 domain-containing protein [Salidesulfovibrio brasiliensis]